MFFSHLLKLEEKKCSNEKKKCVKVSICDCCWKKNTTKENQDISSIKMLP